MCTGNLVMESHEILGGKARVYKRENSPAYQCSAYLEGRNHRATTGYEDFNKAKAFAEEWYVELRGKSKAGVLQKAREKTFRDVAERFLKEYAVITEGQRSLKWVEGNAIRLRVHLLPFFGDLPITDVTASKVQDYRVHRMTVTGQNPAESKSNRPAKSKPPARKTIHNEIVTLRQVLKTAIRHGWLDRLPEVSPPYKTQGKVVHRPWFSPAEYKSLYEHTREYTKTCRDQDRWAAEQVHDFILFMANTGIRPDEAFNLQHRDIQIIHDEGTGERILLIEVRGKRGVGYCKSTANAVRPYERLRDRPKPVEQKAGETPKVIRPAPMDLVFPDSHIKMFNGILRRSGLKLDRDGNARTSYSLRHTYICMRLMEGADIYQVAKNCRTSVEMIEKHYAKHIQTTLDASAINVRKNRPFPNAMPADDQKAANQQ